MRCALALPLVLLGWNVGQLPPGRSALRPENRLQTNGPSQAREAVFDRDSRHPWNRLHQLLYSRTTQDGQVYDQESLEPLFLPASKFLTEGPSYTQAIALLDEFLKERADARIQDPLKCAVLHAISGQSFPRRSRTRRRSCYSTYNAVRSPRRSGLKTSAKAPYLKNSAPAARAAETAGAGHAPDRPQAGRDQCLGGQSDSGRESGRVSEDFRFEYAGQGFLAGGPAHRRWAVDRHQQFGAADVGLVAAPEHTRFTKGRSVFMAFIRLPEGRRATEAFLKRTRAGDPPQFPEGTQTALLRRTLLIDSSGTLRESPLTESLQIRVYRKLDLGIPCAFTLRREDLFAGRNGGLRAVTPDETSYFDFQTRGGDVFEMPKLPPAAAIMQSCEHCHARLDGRGGIHTVNTIYSRFGRGATGLAPTTLRQEASATIDWTRKSFTWGLLQGLWEVRSGE